MMMQNGISDAEMVVDLVNVRHQDKNFNGCPEELAVSAFIHAHRPEGGIRLESKCIRSEKLEAVRSAERELKISLSGEVGSDGVRNLTKSDADIVIRSVALRYLLRRWES
jgi:3-keto-L-gulonate-6-phosphate decarboxylase